MMLSRIRLKRIVTAFLLMGTFVMMGTIYAQDSTRVSSAADSKVRNIDGVAAVVNTGFVTRKEIDDRIAALKKQGAKISDGPELRKAILERLIVEKIQLQNAGQEGIVVTNKELEKIIGDLAEKNKLTYVEFKEKVINSGSSFDRYKEMLRDDIIISRYREREVEAKLKISDAEIDNYITDRTRAISSAAAQSSTQAVNGGPEEIDVAQIFIPLDAGAGAQAEAKKKADVLLREARGDVDFMQLGAMAAKDNPKIKFQELGYRTPDRLPQLFYEAIRNTGSGQVASSVVKSSAGYHVLKVLDRRAIASGAPAQACAGAPEAIARRSKTFRT